MKIFKYMNYVDLISIVENREILFRKISRWEDPHENAIIKKAIKSVYFRDASQYKYKEIVFRELYFNLYLNCFYGQCWTTAKDSDGLWKSFCKDSNGVMIECESDELIEHYRKAYSTIHFGKIKYYKSEKSLSMANEIRKNLLRGIIKGLFYKRHNFSHEKEYRFVITNIPMSNLFGEHRIRIAMDDFDKRDMEELEQFQHLDEKKPQINLNLIKAVYMHPKCDDWVVRVTEKMLGKNSIKCVKSELYNPRITHSFEREIF